MPRIRPAVQASALGLSGLITFGLLLALQGGAAPQYRDAETARAANAQTQQVVIVGQCQPRS